MDERAATVGSEELLAHAGWVRALARRLARDHESAEDLVQETWLTALRKPPRRGPDLRGWLARVVTNSARRQGRADRRRLERETRAHRDAQEPSGAELILEVEEQQTIGRVVLQLAEPYRSVILRHYWRGETPAQIARRTGTSSATVRSQLARGRAELRKALACHYGSDARSMYAGLLTAAGPSRLSWITPWVQGALIVKQSEKLGWIAAAGLGLALVGAGWNALSTGDGAGSVTEAAAAPGLEPLEPEPQVDDTLAATASSSTDARREVTIPSERAALEPTPAPTRVVARFVDSSGGPIAGATLRLEQGHHAATSEADGRVELTVPGSAIQHWNERQRPTSFVAEREGCATRFLLATPSAGMDTDLGELVLEPGGSLAGVVVDGANNLLDDVRVVATGVELKASIETLRSQGPETWAESNFPSSVSERGQFVVRGVPVGHARLWARVEGTGWVISEPIVVRPRSETGGLRIVLRALSPADLIRGVVHDPDGNPVSRAQVTYQFPSTSYGVRYTSTGEDGRFEIIAEVRKAHDLSVEDHENRLRPTIVRGVEPGSDEITIVLPAARWLRVAVIDAETDEPLTEPWIYTHGEDTLEYDSRAAHESDDLGVGGHLVRIPQNSFTLHVRQDGYERWELGPLDPATAPENLEARLTPLAGVSGRVTFQGNPVEGATVRLLRVTQAKVSTISYGFRMRLDPFGDASTLTGPDGRYSVGATEAVAFLLIVTKSGLAAGERGPIDVDPRHDMTDVDIALVHGGAIEGVVLVPPGRDPAGNLVSISRGDGDVRFARTDGDGFYRFESLTPGGWQVAHRDREAQLSVNYRALDGPEPPIEWDCDVIDGGTTRYDIDLRDETPGVLRGRLTLDGAGAFGWSAALARDAGGNVIAPVRSVALEADGRFELHGAAGDWRLSLQSPVGVEPTLVVFADVTLGDVPLDWNTELATGTLSGSSHAGQALVRFSWKNEHGTSCRATFTPAVDGTFHVEVPAGVGRLSRMQPMERAPVAVGWQALRDAEILPGGTLAVELP